jgi:TetR/AcrR family transcriptional regulator, transcriptional repressor for nem operon
MADEINVLVDLYFPQLKRNFKTYLIRQGQVDGSISAAVDSKVTARLMLCLLQGMRVIGKTGRSRQEMMAVADAAMKLLN